jgi:Mini-chromosome maintenance replisome factor
MDVDSSSEEARNCTSSLTIHAIAVKEMTHNNPLLLCSIPNIEETPREEILRSVLDLLTQFMFGDKLAGHYLLLHLISNIYGRVNGEVIGKFSLNLTLSSIPKLALADYIKKLYNLIEHLMPDSIYLPLTVENLNKEVFVPKKDYNTNRLQSGVLQLPKHAQLVLDETKLENGKLEQSGCTAVADLSELVKMQQVNYDFLFYKLPFHTNIPVMILSEKKSILLPVSDETQVLGRQCNFFLYSSRTSWSQ